MNTAVRRIKTLAAALVFSALVLSGCGGPNDDGRNPGGIDNPDNPDVGPGTTHYEVTFDANGGGVTPESGTTYADGTRQYIQYLPTPTMDGYTFDGWYTAKTGGKAVTESTVFDKNTTIYAQWTLITYKVTFDANGGTITQKSGTTGDGWTLESLPEPERDGYTFDGWFTTETGGAKVEESKVYNKAATIYAQWTLNKYKITFDANGGEVTPESGTTGTGWKLASLPTPTRTGYNFDGWYTEETGGTLVTKDTIFNNDAAIYAQWTQNTYKITFNANGGEVTPESDTTGDGWKLESLPTPVRDGYAFYGWFTAAAGGTAVTEDTVFSKAATIYAQWTLNTYTITFDANSGTVTPESVTTGAGWVLASLPTPTRTGYTFDGWYTEETDGDKVTSYTVFNENTTIYAQWTPVTYTVTYILNSGTNDAANPAAYDITAPTVTLQPPARNHYDFGGWYDNASFTGTAVTSIAAGSTGNKTYYAKWTATLYEITYDFDGGTISLANPVTYTVESATVTLNNPSKTGYTFTGWTGTNGTTPQTTVSIAQGSSGDREYTANWTLTYTITYNLDGGTNDAANPATYTVESAAITLSDPSKTGYTFAGWTGTNGTVLQTAVSIAQGSTGNREYTANWAVDIYTITYVLNGGTNDAANPETYDITTPTITLQPPTRTDYVFGGWYASANFTGTAVTSIAAGSMGNKTYYARLVFGLIDDRDNKIYKKVKIGSQTWMAENLNYNASGSVCDNNSADSCAKYGRLYSWNKAMNGAASSSDNPSGVQGACPAGWHLPSGAEWEQLRDFAGGWSTAGKKLKSSSGWAVSGGTDDYGFSALPGGYRYFSDLGLGERFEGYPHSGYWWSSSVNISSDQAVHVTIQPGNNMFTMTGSVNKTEYMYSVRCVAD